MVEVLLFSSKMVGTAVIGESHFKSLEDQLLICVAGVGSVLKDVHMQMDPE